MSACIFPGSFDPITCGHMNLIERAAVMFDHVTVTVMVNRSKNGIIPYEERVRLIRKACEGFANVKAELWEGLLADYMRQHPGSIVIRGVRNSGDFEKELAAADMNRRLYNSMETLLIPALPEWANLSSSAVREVASFGGSISGMVPACILETVKKWLIPEKNKEGIKEDRSYRK